MTMLRSLLFNLLFFGLTAIAGIVTALLAGVVGYLVPPGTAETTVATPKGIVTARRTS